MAEKKYLAMDFGASTGRGILGFFDGECLKMKEIHRFQNYYVPVKGKFYWDIFRLYHEIIQAIAKVKRDGEGKNLYSVGIDTWGTDYGLLDHNGQLIGNCRCMRNADGTYVDLIKKQITSECLFEHTGIQTIYGNTLFQLYERDYCKDPALGNASSFLMLPDLLAYFITGERYHEYTMATTSMMYNPTLKDWDREVLRQLHIPVHIFSKIIMPASANFNILSDTLMETGISELKYVPVGTHDTASAVAAAPLNSDEAFCSSGTWSLLGAEVSEPILSKEAYEANFSNEGTVNGGIRLLKNIMGMWILQQMVKEFEQNQTYFSWDEIVHAASEAEAFRSFIDVEGTEFYQVGHMKEKIQNYCRRTNQAVPENIGQLARCVYESLAMQYRVTFGKLESIIGHSLKALRIVGGGCQNRMLNQFAANAIGKPVYAGPVECACAGNILVQAMEEGEVSSYSQLRDVVRNSFQMDEYEPEDKEKWDSAFEKYLSCIKSEK